jgi:hypothetical protein
MISFILSALLVVPSMAPSVRTALLVHPNPAVDCSGSGRVDVEVDWMAPPNQHLEVYKNSVVLVATGGAYGSTQVSGVKNGDRFSLVIAGTHFTIAQTTVSVVPGTPDTCQ